MNPEQVCQGSGDTYLFSKNAYIVNTMLNVTDTLTYKGHKIEKTESYFQIFYVVDGHLEIAFWSVAEAKRHINGQDLKFNTIDISRDRRRG